MSGLTLATMPHMRVYPAYDPQRDLEPISLVVNAGNVLAVNPSLPVRSVRELIDQGRSRERAAVLWHAFARFDRAFRRRTVQPDGRHPLPAGALQGLGARHAGSHRRPDPAELRQHPGGHRSYPQRQGARARRHLGDPGRAASRRAHDRRSRAVRAMRSAPGSACSRRQKPRPTSSRDCMPKWSRRSPPPRSGSGLRRSASKVWAPRRRSSASISRANRRAWARWFAPRA